MKASDLRLGNLIKIGGNTLDTYQTYKPTDVTLAILNEIAGENEERPDAILSVFQPIPLTEDILLRFGYIQEENQMFFSDDYRWFIQKYKGEWTLFRHSETETIYIAKVEFAHKLQNVINALTGEELILK